MSLQTLLLQNRETDVIQIFGIEKDKLKLYWKQRCVASKVAEQNDRMSASSSCGIDDVILISRKKIEEKII